MQEKYSSTIHAAVGAVKLTEFLLLTILKQLF